MFFIFMLVMKASPLLFRKVSDLMFLGSNKYIRCRSLLNEGV